MTISGAPARASARLGGISPADLHFWGVAALVFAASIPLRLAPTTPDVSWLIDVCARILDGERGFIDVFETTPPTPTLLYMPGAFLEKYAGVSAEIAVIIYTYLAYIGCLALSSAILPRRIAGLGSARWRVILPIWAYLAIVTNDTFSQRETFAVALMTPMLCVIAAWRETGEPPKALWRALAALLAGLAVAVKPPLFALPLLLCGGYLAFAARSLRPLYTSGLIASALAFLLITAASLWAFPYYLSEVYPLMRELYVPLGWPPGLGLVNTSFLLSIGLLIIAARKFIRLQTFFEMERVLLIAALGFAIVFFIQRKYFDYHVVPIGLFLFVAATAAALDARSPGRRVLDFGAALSLAAISAMLFLTFDDDEPTMRNREWARSLDRPTAMAISTGEITGYPLAREIKARWVNRTHCQWSVVFPETVMRRQPIPEEQRRLYKAYQDRELDYVARLVPRARPEIIIQGTTATDDWLTRQILKRNPTLLDDYAVIAEEGLIRIWRRKSGVIAEGAPPRTGQ